MSKCLYCQTVRNFKPETSTVSSLENIATIQSVTSTRLHLLAIAAEQQLKHTTVDRYILLIKKNDNGAFAGKTFCITGKLVSFPNRDALVADIESKSGIVVPSVTAKTNYLITNDKTSGSSKNKAAEKHGTKIITEIEYINGNL